MLRASAVPAEPLGAAVSLGSVSLRRGLSKQPVAFRINASAFALSECFLVTFGLCLTTSRVLLCFIALSMRALWQRWVLLLGLAVEAELRASLGARSGAKCSNAVLTVTAEVPVVLPWDDFWVLILNLFSITL